ncbi:helix-turn-helix domain-containing protein [Variovorax sp. LT1R20]|uniref:helix-turn-helix domain-containing protein n=1 Tax=Variovorax sp. LT1R20 TaxID=3443729 RepID=UPI003F4767B0
MPNPKRKPRDPKKKGPPPAKKTTPKPTKKTGSVQNKTRGNDRRAQAANDTLFPKVKARPLSTAQQQHLTMEELRASEWVTTHTLRAVGVHHPAGRLKELRDRYGFDIETTLVDSWDSDGFKHCRVARYRLVGHPQLGLDFGREAANDPVSPKKGSKE